MRTAALLLTAATCLPTNPAVAQDPRPHERGYPVLRNYGPGDYLGGTQSFDLAQDPSGLLYVANLQGLLVHDGAWWQQVATDNGLAVFCVATDAQGQVAIGGVGEMGMVAADEIGVLRYHSLLDRLPEGEHAAGDVWRVHSTTRGFVFLADRGLYRFYEDQLTRIASFDDPNAPVLTHPVGDQLLVWIPQRGLFRVGNDELESIPGGEAFRDRRLDLVLPIDGDQMLLAVRDEGLRLWDGESETPVGPDTSQRLLTHPARTGTVLPDGRTAIGTDGGGILILDEHWQSELAIDAQSGLPDVTVYTLLADHDGSLWAALDNGLSRIEVSQPLTVFDARSGLAGSAQSVTRHAGRLWVGTTAGLFVLDGEVGVAGVHRVAGFPEEAALPMDLGDGLLVAADSGIYHGTPPRFTRIPGTENLLIYSMMRSLLDPDRVWVGTRNGVISLRRSDNGDGDGDGDPWQIEAPIEDSPRYVTNFVERQDGTLWGGSIVSGVVRIDIANRRALSSGEGEVSIRQVADRILASFEDRVLLLDEGNGELRRDPGLEQLAGYGTMFRFAADPAGRIWLNTVPPHVAVPLGGGSYASPLPLPSVDADEMQDIVSEPDGVIWMMTNRGLFRFAGDVADLHAAPAKALVRRVGRTGGEVLFGGAPGATGSAPVLPYQHGRLRIEFAPASFRPGVEYQYRLDPVETQWSAWSTDAFTEYTRLAARSYSFRVRSRSPGGEAGPEAAWDFHVTPPWYRTPLAWLLWPSLALVALIGYTRLRTNALRRHATNLEAVVAERTLELAAANERLDELSRRDDLTGLWNRRHLDEMLEREWHRSRRHSQPLAFVLMDLDHFKELNDAFGHAAGDRFLRRIGELLRQRVSRSGEVVARYGGEEFALLLPGSNRDTAAQLAERLRAEVAGLDLASELGAEDPVTASFGVASNARSSSAEMLEAADAALYRAKSDGRNCVRIDDV